MFKVGDRVRIKGDDWRFKGSGVGVITHIFSDNRAAITVDGREAFAVLELLEKVND